MTDTASPPPSDLARFLQDWNALWWEEMRVQAGDPAGMEMGRAMMAFWTQPPWTQPPWTRGLVPSAHDPRAAPGAQTVAAASDARDGASERDTIERLTRRVDALEARLAILETRRRRAGG